MFKIRYASSPASSISSERLWSYFTDLLTPKRRSMGKYLAAQIIFLKYNQELLIKLLTSEGKKFGIDLLKAVDKSKFSKMIEETQDTTQPIAENDTVLTFSKYGLRIDY